MESLHRQTTLALLVVAMPCSCFGLSVREQRLIPAADQAAAMRDAGLEDMPIGSDKTVGCNLLPGCSDVICMDPFVLKREPGQCCPYCEPGPDSDVQADSH